MNDPLPSSRPSVVDDLIPLGWSDALASTFATVATSDAVPARVVRVDRVGFVAVVAGSGTVRCTGGDAPGEPGPPATGDWAAVAPYGDGLRLAALLPRRSALRRAGEHGELEVLAANVDSALVVHALDRPLKPRRIERTLVAVWDGGVEPVIVLSKIDLVDRGAVDDAVAAMRRVAAGVPVLALSNATGDGVDAVAAVARPGTTIALIGESGAGKSSLVNRLLGASVQSTAATRDGDGKGRHTTTSRELIPLPSGGVLIDTPGLRSLALWEGERGRVAAFPDVAALSAECRFGDCRHAVEPGCAVQAAIAAGRLDVGRLASYQKLLREQRSQARRAAARRRRAESGRRGYRRARNPDWE